jgi:hypothetical protein
LYVNTNVSEEYFASIFKASLEDSSTRLHDVTIQPTTFWRATCLNVINAGVDSAFRIIAQTYTKYPIGLGLLQTME